jgi:hypothetical protein
MTTSSYIPPQAPAGGVARDLWQQRAGRWLLRASVLGLSLSLIVHVIFLFASGIIQLGDANAPPGNPQSNVVSMAVISETELSAIEGAQLDSLAPSVEVSSAMPNASPSPLDTPGAGGGSGSSDPGDLGSLGSGLGGAGDGEGIGAGSDTGGSGGGGTSFFGVEARGSRFIYIVDTSGSMMDAKLATLADQLGASISKLKPSSRFSVILFNSNATSLLDPPGWVEASTNGKRSAIARIARLEAQGGTEPFPAFQQAFRLRPRADAIYFMTDGLFNAEVVAQVARLNAFSTKVPIHTIAFGSVESEDLLKAIAQESGGTYTYVPEPKR